MAERRATIWINEKNQCFEVHTNDQGIVTAGQLWAAEKYCSDNGYAVRNQQEINAIKRGNMPVAEGFHVIEG